MTPSVPQTNNLPPLGVSRIPTIAEREAGASPASRDDINMTANGHAYRLLERMGSKLLLCYVRSTSNVRGDAFDVYTRSRKSGRWVAGGDPELERMVDYAELPLDFADGDPLSPNRRWSVSTGTVQTVLRRADGLVKILPVGGFSQPLWRDDSAAFLLNSTIGAVLVDVPEATLRVVISGAASILGWRGDRILWFTQTVGSDE